MAERPYGKAGTKPKQKPRKISKAEQSRWFKEAARELGADEDPESFNKVLDKLDLRRPDRKDSQ
jgi:hypothetical protein